MSTTLFSNASPFATALPAPHAFMAYDADGDAIMTDAVTGLPITYGGSGSKRSRSASLDSDSADSRPSKRSRMSSDDDENDGEGVNIPPPAPKKAARPARDDDDEDGEGQGSVLRNLATQMAEAVLAGEPRDYDAPLNHVAIPAPVGPSSNAVNVPPGGDGPDEEPEWGVSVTISDLALRLDMRHPRVVLNLLRFVSTYNELAPEGEEIHFPLMDGWVVDRILRHESVTNPCVEFAADVDELRALINQYSSHEEYHSEDNNEADDSDWCVSVRVSDLALRLDMRHPRVVLNLLRFVRTYNELAPPEEDIHLPPISGYGASDILGHDDVMNPPADFAADAEELRDLVDYYHCRCFDCEPYEDYEDDDTESVSSDRSRGRYRY